MSKKKSQVENFKAGDRIRNIDIDSNNFNKIGTVFGLNEEGNGYLIQYDDGHTGNYGIDSDYKAFNVKFLLKYMLDVDPIEEFETMEEVDKRIADLVKNKRSLKRDSIFVYEVAKIHHVQVEVKITKKLKKA